MRSGVQTMTARFPRQFRPQVPTLQTNRKTLAVELSRRLVAACRGFAAEALIALSACTGQAPIAVDSYCPIKATELIDLRDPGLQRLTPVNQGAVLTGDDSWNRFCKGAVNKGR